MRAVSGRAWSEARAPAPPPSDKPGETPPGDAYAPPGAVAAASTTTAPRHHHRQTGPRAISNAPHPRTISQLHRGEAPRRRLDFRLLKKTRKQRRLQNRSASPDTDENNEAQTNAEPF
ncbi:jg19655 [Pararge aegeria aegeria]|uniref:Jg19655 protein n=1 Tax=Pararge aegeria aegeria TaxID=348720 RepID=A0A8S4SAH2_9NEOP|nr:jg19655 [Pararge aegeria aegeria]